MVTFALCFVLFLSTACSSPKRRAQSTSNNTGQSDAQVLSKMLAENKKKNRIQKLLSTKFKSPAQEAELAVLKKGGTQREALLAAKKYEKGLSDLEASELTYLEAGKPEREAELRAKRDNRQLNMFETEELNQIENGPQVVPDTPTDNTPLLDLSH